MCKMKGRMDFFYLYDIALPPYGLISKDRFIKHIPAVLYGKINLFYVTGRGEWKKSKDVVSLL